MCLNVFEAQEYSSTKHGSTYHVTMTKQETDNTFNWYKYNDHETTDSHLEKKKISRVHHVTCGRSCTYGPESFVI